MRDDDLGLSVNDELGHCFVQYGVPDPVNRWLMLGLKKEARGRAHFGQDVTISMLTGDARNIDSPPGEDLLDWRHPAKSLGRNLGLIARLAKKLGILGQQLLGGGIKVVGMQVRDEDHLDAANDLARRTGQLDQWIRRLACERRSGMFRIEVGINEEMPPGVFDP